MCVCVCAAVAGSICDGDEVNIVPAVIRGVVGR